MKETLNYTEKEQLERQAHQTKKARQTQAHQAWELQKRSLWQRINQAVEALDRGYNRLHWTEKDQADPQYRTDRALLIRERMNEEDRLEAEWRTEDQAAEREWQDTQAMISRAWHRFCVEEQEAKEQRYRAEDEAKQARTRQERQAEEAQNHGSAEWWARHEQAKAEAEARRQQQERQYRAYQEQYEREQQYQQHAQQEARRPADPAETRDATTIYRAYIKRFHPDRFMGKACYDQLTELCKQVTCVYAQKPHNLVIELRRLETLAQKVAGATA